MNMNRRPNTTQLLLLLSTLPFISFVTGLKLTSLTGEHTHSLSHETLHQRNDQGASESAYDDRGDDYETETYGVDASFPTHHELLHLSSLDFLERRDFYKSYMRACKNKMQPVGYLCDEAEKVRMESNLYQPARMKNYTELGFQKVPTPPKLQESLIKHFKSTPKQKESWDTQNGFHPSPNSAITHLNHWESNSQSVPIKEEKLRTTIWDEVQSILQSWTGISLSPSALYTRIYTNQSLIPSHVDANPLIVSAIIRVNQEVEEDWIIEMIGHDGKAYNVSLDVGEMLLYEGASVIHGRPFGMEGVYASDVFVHFEPIGHYMNQPPLDTDINSQDSLEDLYEQALAKAKGNKMDNAQNLAIIQSTQYPNYIEAGSLQSKRWMQTHERAKLRFTLNTANLNAHTAASAGDLEALITLAEKDPASIKKVDNNGWTPLHEAVRSEQLEVIKYLLDQGLDINLRTHGGDGGSPLWWAKKYHGKDSKIVKFLEAKGAVDVAPANEK